MFRKALTGKVLHEIHGEVLISNIENEIGSSLVDSLGNVGLGQQVINLVGISGEVLVYQVEWIPLPVIGEVVGLGFPERMESFIQKVVQIEVEIVLEPLGSHVFTTVAEEFELGGGHFPEGLHNLGAGEVGLTRVGKDADFFAECSLCAFVQHF